MSEIRIEKPSQEKLEKLGVFNWPIWEKDKSRFDWHYDEPETCYFLEGDVIVEAKSGETVSLGKGTLATFPKGLSCIWDIKEKVRKHYNLS